MEKLEELALEELAYSVQDTSQATSSEMQSILNCYKETPLSTKETHQTLKSKVSQENNSGSTGCLMSGNLATYTRQESNEDITLGDCDTEDPEPDHKASMNNRQENMDLYTSPQTNSSEIFENNSAETDMKFEKSKIVDAAYPNDHSMSPQQDTNVPIDIRSDDHCSKLYKSKISKSEDGTTAQLVDNLALRVDGTTELFESEQNGKEPCKPNDDILAHHEVNNIFATTDDSERKTFTLNPDDDFYTEPCNNTAPNQQQDGGNMCEDETIDSEDQRAADHGEVLNEPLYPTPSIKEADAQEKINKVFHDTSPNDSSSTDLHLQDSNVTKIISPDNNSTMDLKSEDSSAEGNEKRNFVSAGKILESVDNDDVDCESIHDIHHEVTKSLSTASQTGKNASSINNESTNTKAYNISACSKLQGGGDVDTKEPENKMSMDHGRSNNESSCLESNNVKDDSMAGNEDNKISPKVHRSNNRTTELFGSGHHSNVGCRPKGDLNTFSTVSPTVDTSNFKNGSKIDACTTMTSSELKTVIIEEDRNKDFTQRDTSTACFEYDKNAMINPENKMFTDHGRNNNKFSRLEGKNKGKNKMFVETRPNGSSSTQEVIGPADNPSKSCIPIISSPQVSTTLFLAAEDPRSKKHPKKALGSKQNDHVNCKPNYDKQAHSQLTGARKTEGNASIDVGCKKTTNVSKTNNGTSPEAYPGRRRGNKNVKSNNIPKNHNPEDKTSSGNGGEKNVLSFLEPKSQHRSQPGENRSTVFNTTRSTNFQPHGDVLTNARSLNENSRTMNRGLWNKFCVHVPLKCFFLLWIMVNPVQASPIHPQWRQMLFCSNKSLMNQPLKIENLTDRHRVGYTFIITTLPFYICSDSGYHVFATNETCVEMLITDDLSTGDWRLEYGQGRNGKLLAATRGELLSEQSVMKKISEYKHQTEHQSQTQDKSETMDKSETKNKSETKDETNIKLIAGIVTGVLVAFVISILLWKFCPKFRSWLVTRRRPSTSDPFENGRCNGDNHNDDDETQSLSPESTEEPNPQTNETLL